MNNAIAGSLEGIKAYVYQHTIVVAFMSYLVKMLQNWISFKNLSKDNEIFVLFLFKHKLII